MKIAFDAKRFFNNNSGLGNYSRDLVRILSEHFPDDEFHLINKNKSEKGAEILQLPNVFFHQASGGILPRQLKSGIAAQNIGADIFHGLSGELPLKWNQKPIKKIVTIHDLIFERYPQYYSFTDRKIHYWKFKKAAEKADLVIAISEQTKRDIIEFLKIPEEKIRVVYQGCHDVFKQKLPDDFLIKIKEKYNLPEIFVLSVGTIEPRKNLLNIVKALEKTGIPLVAIGKKTSYFKKVQNQISKSRVETHFPENVSMQELAAFYQLARIFIYPSLFEGFGIPVIEALFSGTPVITSNLSSLPEAGGAAALYVDPKNHLDLRAKILHLWENAAERERRAEIGLQYAQKFSDENIAKNLMEVYREVLEY